MGRIRLSVLLGAAIAVFGSSAAYAQTLPVVVPIPGDPGGIGVETYFGAPATPNAIEAPAIPRHPFMAPNGRSNIHDDAYQSDTYTQSGPLGDEPTTASTLQVRECASLTFDSAGRIVAICVGLDRPVLQIFDPHTLQTLATMNLPPRPLAVGGNPLSDFSGGGYFYLDNQDRAVVPTGERHLLIVATEAGPSFVVQKNFDLTSVVPSGDAIVATMPDWGGLIWFVSKEGVVGNVNPESGAVRSVDTGEKIGNSFAVDETGGVYIVTDAAMYRFDAGSDGSPIVSWREGYGNIGAIKPGQTQAGSGTTPTILGEFVAITDNADPMNVVVYRRARSLSLPSAVLDRLRRLHRRCHKGTRPRSGAHHRRCHRKVRKRRKRILRSSAPVPRHVCAQPVFAQGAGNTDNSLIGVNRSLIVENNYGYSGLAATMLGGVTTPGLERVDINPDGNGCHLVWHSEERAPSVVPKLSLANGLVYTYTKPPRSDNADAWYLTALDFRDGRTVWKRLAGTGFGYNNNYAPVSIGPDGTAYVGVLGGLTTFSDAQP